MTNIITACFGGTRFTNTRPAWLIDHGMVLKITGVELPETYFVDFANSKAEQATRVLGNADGVVIPDQYFLSNAPQIFAWVYLTTGDSGFTTLQVTIPLSQRPDVSTEPPTPQETDLIEQAIAALNDGVERAETAAEDAEQSAEEAKAAAENIQQTVEDALQDAKDSGEFDGKDGEDGTNGATFIPSVDSAGNISWTNDGGLPNPEPRNIRGPKGDKLKYADLTAADKADLIQGPIADAQTAAVNAVNSAGTSNVSAVNSAGTTQVSNVNQAGATQAAAVEQKGEEALAELQEYADLPEDVADLKSALNNIIEESETDVNLNFNIEGYYKYGKLNNLDTSVSDSRSCIIPVSGGEQYKVSGQSNYGQKLACVYDENDNILLTIIPENNSQVITNHEFVIPNQGVKMSLSSLHNFPAYAVTLKKIETALKPITEENLDIIETAEPINIFNYEEAITGGFFNYNGSVTDNVSACRVFVPVHSGNAVCHVNTSMFGYTLAARIPYFDYNKNYLGFIQGTIIGDGFQSQIKVLEITIPINAKYIGISNRIECINRLMVVYGTVMPTDFIPYLAEYKHFSDDLYVNSENVKGGSKNPLFNKTVAFDGDSICRGISAEDGKSGWAGRIGNANGMNWKNFGVSGATITNNHSHCILNSLNDIHTYMPTLDYYIFEGGSNDADNTGVEIGTVIDNDYSGSYDTATFSGAFETLIYNALTFYPTTKIGYIVAQKLGKTNNANYANRKAYFVRAMEICKKWGVPYINLWDGSHLNPNLASMYAESMTPAENIAAGKMYVDGQHLTPSGYEYITPIIEAWMKTI